MSILDKLGLSDKAKVGTTSSSEFSAEGGTPTFDSIPFRVQPGSSPALNTFVLVFNPNEKNIAHYGRIVEGFEINTKASPGRLQEQEAFNLGRRDLRESDQAPHIVRIMKLEILGELHLENDNLEVREISTLPQTARPVYAIEGDTVPHLLNTPTDDEQGLYIGDVDAGVGSARFLLPNLALSRHMAVLGKTGVGKSYAVGVLIEELFEKKIPIISFDVLGDTRPVATELGGIAKEVGVKDGYALPYSLIGWQELAGFFPNLTVDHLNLAQTAYAKIYDDAIAQLEEGDFQGISYNEFLGEIAHCATEIGSKAKDNAIARVRHALRSPLLTEKSVTWMSEIAKHPFINLYVGHLGQFNRNLAVGATARILQYLRRKGSIPPFVMIIDEAHLFLPSGGTSSSNVVIREMIRTARHDSIGIILVSQSPSSIDRQSLLTCNTRLIFALDPEDLRIVAGQLGDLPTPIIDRIPRLAQGRAIVASGGDLLRHPVQIRIRARKTTKHHANTPDLSQAVKTWNDQKRKE